MKKQNAISTRNPYVRIKNTTSGITLIALVITIIVLLILAGVSISLVTGENGVLGRAIKGREKTQQAQADEREKLDSLSDIIDNHGKIENGGNEGGTGNGNGSGESGGVENTDPYEDETIVATPSKYFTFTYNDDRTAILTGVNLDYAETSFYAHPPSEDLKFEYAESIIDEEGNRITDVVIPYEVEKDGITYTVTEIGASAFGSQLGGFCCCDDPIFSSFVIPNTITKIGEKAFYYLINLKSVKILGNNLDIGENAFEYCKTLSSIIMTDEIISIGNSAFYNCQQLNNVYYRGSETDWNNITIGYSNEYLTNTTIHYNSDYNNIEVDDYYGYY